MKSNFVVWTHLAKGPDKLCIVSDLENVDDDYDLKKGVSRAKGFPANASIAMDPDYPDNTGLADNVYNIDRLLIVSKPFHDFLSGKSENLEFLPLTIENHEGKVASKDYFILNPLNPVDCLDAKASGAEWSDFLDDEIDEVKKIVIDEKKVPENVSIFRMKYFYDVVLVRRSLAEAIDEKGFTGVIWTELDKFKS